MKNIDTNFRLRAKKKFAYVGAAGATALLLSSCVGLSSVPCDDGYICSGFPAHVTEVIQKLENSSFGCENPKVYLENHAVNFKSPNGPDTLTCNEYYVDDNDYFFGEKFDIFESELELEMYYFDACHEALFISDLGLYMNDWRVSPNVMFSDINYEDVDEASAKMAANTLSAGFAPVEVAFACDAFK